MKFNKGYGAVREKLSKSSKYTRSCYNCEYFYQSYEDEEEVCQNPNVLQYDMVITSSSIYCSRWEMCKRRTNTSFKKGIEFNGRKKKTFKRAGKKSS